MEFRLLGSLEVLVEGRELSLGGARQRAVLAILLLHRGEVVSVDRIVDELWGERLPDTATKTVQVYVSRLRKELGEGVLVTRGGGYVLEVDADDVDAHRFERLASEGRDALDQGDPRAAAATLREALELWRGPPLTDLAYESFAQNEIARLEELRLDALENRVEADLALARHTELVGELEALVAEHPTRERLRGQLMLALYRSGRQSEALESYRDARHTLEEELGLEPGPELQQLEREILTQDPALEGPRRERPVAGLHRRRGGVLIAFGGGLLLAAAVAAILASGGASELAEANSLAVIDPASSKVVDTVPTGIDPADVSADADHVWVANRGDGTVTQIDPGRKVALGTTPAETRVGGIAAGAGGVWIGDSRGERLVRLDPAFPSAARSIRLAPTPQDLDFAAVNPVAVGHGAVWVPAANGEIARVDPRSNRIVDTIPVGNSPTSIATGAGGVWVTDAIDNAVTRIDPAGANAVTATIPVGQGPSAIAVGEGAVWVANTQDDTVSRIDPRSAAVTQTITVGARPTGIAAAEDAVWVADSLGGTVSRIDPETNGVEATVEIGEAPQGITVAHGLVWVTVQASAAAPDAPLATAGEDVARVLAPTPPGSIDPVQSSVAFEVSFATCALLFNYPDRPFPMGSRLVPEVAAGEPLVSDDGRTYRFTLRSGFRFAPPSNEPVTAAAFERALERVLSPVIDSYGRLLVKDIIVGADDYRAGRAKTLEGVDSRDGDLVIRLTRPVPNLPARLASPHLCAVPPDTPLEDRTVEVVPSAGPYYIGSYSPERSLVLRRNPNYGGERPQGLGEIRFEYGVPAERGVEEVEAGRADYVSLQPGEGAVPASTQLVDRLEARYGPGSEAARAGRQQLFTGTVPSVDSFIFNTHTGPFTDPRLRRAVNYAIDRPALSHDTGFGFVGKSTDQFIPPGIPGFDDAAIYPLGGPDLATARRLAGGGRHHAVLYTCSRPGCTRNGQTLRSNLDAIGIDLEVRQFPSEVFFEAISAPDRPWDLTFFPWVVDYADPFDYINTLYGPDAVAQPSNFRDPGMWRRMAAAARLTGEERLRAYARLDRDLAERAAPAAVFASGVESHFLSARMGCQVLHPLYGLDLAALCVRDEVEDE
jgi:YVTN family beta-propeller protein